MTGYNLPPGMSYAPGDGPEAEAWDYYWDQSHRPEDIYQEYSEAAHQSTDLFEEYLHNKDFEELIDKDFEDWRYGLPESWQQPPDEYEEDELP